MVKYVESKVVFEEIPDKVTLAVTISNCPFSCKGCHSDYLQTDCGEVLTNEVIDKLIEDNKGINCFLFLGDGNNINELCHLSSHIKEKYSNISTAVYSGYPDKLLEYMAVFDYIKTGGYIESCGDLTNPNTNQRLYKWNGETFEDVTKLFWKR